MLKDNLKCLIQTYLTLSKITLYKLNLIQNMKFSFLFKYCFVFNQCSISAIFLWSMNFKLYASTCKILFHYTLGGGFSKVPDPESRPQEGTGRFFVKIFRNWEGQNGRGKRQNHNEFIFHKFKEINFSIKISD